MRQDHLGLCVFPRTQLDLILSVAFLWEIPLAGQALVFAILPALHIVWMRFICGLQETHKPHRRGGRRVSEDTPLELGIALHVRVQLLRPVTLRMDARSAMRERSRADEGNGGGASLG